MSRWEAHPAAAAAAAAAFPAQHKVLYQIKVSHNDIGNAHAELGAQVEDDQCSEYPVKDVGANDTPERVCETLTVPRSQRQSGPCKGMDGVRRVTRHANLLGHNTRCTESFRVQGSDLHRNSHRLGRAKELSMTSTLS